MNELSPLKNGTFTTGKFVFSSETSSAETGEIGAHSSMSVRAIASENALFFSFLSLFIFFLPVALGPTVRTQNVIAVVCGLNRLGEYFNTANSSDI